MLSWFILCLWGSLRKKEKCDYLSCSSKLNKDDWILFKGFHKANNHQHLIPFSSVLVLLLSLPYSKFQSRCWDLEFGSLVLLTGTLVLLISELKTIITMTSPKCYVQTLKRKNFIFIKENLSHTLISWGASYHGQVSENYTL